MKNTSIRQKLLSYLLIPLLTLAVLSTVGSYYMGLALARGVFDNQLLNSADSVLTRLKVNGSTLSIDVPPAVQSVLRHNDRDEFFFQILDESGKQIGGTSLIPPPEGNVRTPEFRTLMIRDREFRIASLRVDTPDFTPSKQVILQVAETRNTRKALATQITLSILVAQLLLILSGALAIWIGVRRGLAPLFKVEQALSSRSPNDLSPLDVEAPTEIVPLVRELNSLFKKLADEIDLQRRFVSNAAHQLRTPIAVLGTYCDFARKVNKEPQVDEALSELESAVARMGKLVGRLLMLARSEPSVAAHRAMSPVDLNSVASHCAANYVPQAIKKKIELEFSSSEGSSVVNGDSGALEELVNNLVENAISYTLPGGNVTVRVENKGEFVELVVDDDGPGIPVEERPRVLERFYRVPGTEQAGTGLGLAIVKEIAVAHGAAIVISDARVGCGTSVRVRFPQPEMPLHVVSGTEHSGFQNKEDQRKKSSRDVQPLEK